MSLIRAILNNGFFFIVLIVAAGVYLAYSDNIKRDHGLLPEEPTTVAKEESHQPKAVNMTNAPGIIVTTDESTPSENKVDKAPEKDVVLSEASLIETPSTESENLTNQSEEAPVAATVAANEVIPEPLIANSASNEADSNEQDSENIETTKTDVNEASEQVNQASLENTKVLTTELDSILNDDSMSIKTPEFKTQQEALAAAHEATTKKDHLTAAKIYMDTTKKQPSANVVGLLAQSLHQADKKEWAAKAWLESAKMLVAENRFSEAAMLSSRLAPIAPAEAREIQMNLQKMHQAYMAKKHEAMKARMLKQQQMAQKNTTHMPQQNTQAMPPMKPMPKYNYAPMKPMAPMQPMQQMPQQNTQAMPAIQKMSVNPQMIEMQKAQKARYHAYLMHMKRQQHRMRSGIPPTQMM